MANRQYTSGVYMNDLRAGTGKMFVKTLGANKLYVDDINMTGSLKLYNLSKDTANNVNGGEIKGRFMEMAMGYDEQNATDQVVIYDKRGAQVMVFESLPLNDPSNVIQMADLTGAITKGIQQYQYSTIYSYDNWRAVLQYQVASPSVDEDSQPHYVIFNNFQNGGVPLNASFILSNQETLAIDGITVITNGFWYDPLANTWQVSTGNSMWTAAVANQLSVTGLYLFAPLQQLTAVNAEYLTASITAPYAIPELSAGDIYQVLAHYQGTGNEVGGAQVYGPSTVFDFQQDIVDNVIPGLIHPNVESHLHYALDPLELNDISGGYAVGVERLQFSTGSPPDWANVA